VWCDFFGGQRWAGLLGRASVVGESLFEGVAAHRSAAIGREQWVAGLSCAFGQPVAQGCDGAGGQRGNAVLAALAVLCRVPGYAELRLLVIAFSLFIAV
jgi:hypothetical protein